MRNKKVLKLMLAGLVVACGFGVITFRIARATPGHGITGTIVGPVAFDEIDIWSKTDTHRVRIETKGLSDVYIVNNKIAPGGDTGWHSHPGPSFVIVKSGEATEYSGDDPHCRPKIYPAGTGFTEDAGRLHLVRNEGSSELELIAFQLLPLGAVRRIDEPRPGACPF